MIDDYMMSFLLDARKKAKKINSLLMFDHDMLTQDEKIKLDAARERAMQCSAWIKSMIDNNKYIPTSDDEEKR